MAPLLFVTVSAVSIAVLDLDNYTVRTKGRVPERFRGLTANQATRVRSSLLPLGSGARLLPHCCCPGLLAAPRTARCGMRVPGRSPGIVPDRGGIPGPTVPLRGRPIR